MIGGVARLATPAESVDKMVQKEYYHGMIAAALRLQQAPDELYGVIEHEIDSRPPSHEEDESED